MRTVLQDVDRVMRSPWYLAWRVTHPLDHGKILLERDGRRRPLSDDPWARTFIEAIRVGLSVEAQPPPAPASSVIPAPFNGRGLVLLEPNGGTEDIGAAKTAGFTYLLLNIAHVSGGDWATHRQRAGQHGLAVVPWRRVYTLADVEQVERTRAAWGSPACAHNLENPEATTTLAPAKLAAAVDAIGWNGPRAVMTEPWMQEQDWSPLAKWVALPETFLNADPRYLPNDLVTHAHNVGCPRAVPMFGWGQWADAPGYVPPSVYLDRWSLPMFAVYAGDGRESSYGQWKR